MHRDWFGHQVEIFQDYCDTVISIGLSHLPRNNGIFASSDIAVGIDVLTDIEDETNMASPRLQCGQALPSELEFISAVAANMCAFRFRGVSSVSNISKLIEISRVSLEAAISAAMFLVTGCLSLSLYIVFSLCMPPRMMTYCPILGATLFLQIILPVTTLALAMSDGDNNCMKRVPPKNDLNSVFGGKEGYSQYSRTLLKALLPALLPQVLHPIVYGTLMLKFEYPLVHSRCSRTSSWIDVVRCDGLNSYHGSVRYSSGCVIFVVFVLCIVVSSASYVRRFDSVWEQKPWTYNFLWVIASLANIFLTSIYVYLAARGAVSSLTWHYFLLSILFPFSCLFWVERWKVTEKKQDDRAEKLRRLQFETRLGAYSPR
jgi:magnesium-transporting ATPase (P-type)